MADAHRLHGRRPRARTGRGVSREAERQLTDELRDAVGRDDVAVTPERLERAQTAAGRGGLRAALSRHRLLIGISFLVALVVGGVLALATGSWWLLLVPVVLHAVGTLLAASMGLQMTTQVEHLSPGVSGRLEAEGVSDPDRVFTELVEDAAGSDHARGAPELVSTGANERTVRAEDDPGRATVEQRTAMTPASGVSQPAGEGSVIAAMPAAVVVAVSLITLVVAIVEGGALWFPAVVVLGAAVAWFLVQQRVDGRAEERAAGDGPGSAANPATHRDRGDARTGVRSRLAPVLLVVVTGVALFTVVVALIV